jgi:GH18 family chitinase
MFDIQTMKNENVEAVRFCIVHEFQQCDHPSKHLRHICSCEDWPSLVKRPAKQSLRSGSITGTHHLPNHFHRPTLIRRSHGPMAADIVLGFGFYGRSFTLADSSRGLPGCPFSGASNPGPCTAAAGILGYYEILGVLNADSSISPVHDTEAAVLYFTFDNNQWVSYDNEQTFQQKVDWTNSVGMGGAMIWASDLGT